MIHNLIQALDQKFNFEEAKAHCDVPCGIYDPIVAQINAQGGKAAGLSGGFLWCGWHRRWRQSPRSGRTARCGKPASDQVQEARGLKRPSKETRCTCCPPPPTGEPGDFAIMSTGAAGGR